MGLASIYGEIIRDERLKQCWSQKDLSIRTFGYENISYISNLERGKLENVSSGTLDRLLFVLDLDNRIDILLS